jgi:trk system potassium uptake protein TrkH
MLLRVSKEDLKLVLRDMGLFLQYNSALYLVPILTSLIFKESIEIILRYAIVGIFSFAVGFFLKKAFKTSAEMELKHAFLIISLLWIIVSMIAAFPFVLIQGMSFNDSFFEVMSAITTTGLTVIPQIENLPKSLIFWRSLLSWIGGVGIIVLALVGILTTYTKSAKLLSAEGRQEPLRPNIKTTVKEIWAIYFLLTIFGVIIIFLSSEKLTLFDAINYSMSAISTTGMDSIENGLIGMHNPWLDLSLIIVMFLGSISFSVHYLFLKKRKFDAYIKDIEFRVLLMLTALSIVLIFPKMLLFYGSSTLGLESAFFHTVTSITNGGFALVPVTDVAYWDDFIKIILIGLMFIGGSSGSTAGGIKISRFVLFVKSIAWRIKRSVLPEETFFARKFEGRDVNDTEIKEVTQFILLYALFIIIGTIVLTLDGNDLGNSLFEVTSAQSNAGVSTGITNPGMPLLSKIVLIFNMWVGRLEIIPLLVIIGFAMSYKKK